MKLILAVRALNEYGIEQTKVKENKSSDILHSWSSFLPAVKSESEKSESEKSGSEHGKEQTKAQTFCMAGPPLCQQ